LLTVNTYAKPGVSDRAAAWTVGRAGRVVLVVRVSVPRAGAVTTAMPHRRGPDHHDAPLSWLFPGRRRAGAGAVPVPLVRERPLGCASKGPTPKAFGRT